jgi:ribosome maturation factor RimP
MISVLVLHFLSSLSPPNRNDDSLMPPAILTPHQIKRLEKAVLTVADACLAESPYIALGCTVEEAFGRLAVQLFVEGRSFWISIDQCVEVTRLVDEAIEGLAELQAPVYNLEVGSPGLFRQLQAPREFSFYRDRRVHFTAVDAPVFGQPSVAMAGVAWDYPEKVGVLKCMSDTAELGVIIEWEQSKALQVVLLKTLPVGWGIFLAPQVEWPKDDEPSELDDEQAQEADAAEATDVTAHQWRSL